MVQPAPSRPDWLKTAAFSRQAQCGSAFTWYVLNMSSRSLNGTNGAGRNRATKPGGRMKRRATKAQQAARGRFLAELAKKGAVPSDNEVQAILRELEGG
jgi:hypothetical protein